MASELSSRISGKVVHTERRSFGSGERAFNFLEVHVQTSVTAITPVRYTDRWSFETPRAGDAVDIEVNVSAFAGRNGVEIRAAAVRPYDESFYLEAAGVAA